MNYKVGDKFKIGKNKACANIFTGEVVEVIENDGKGMTVQNITTKHMCTDRNPDYHFDPQPIEKSWETLEVGDIIVGDDNTEAKVLAVLGDVFLRSLFGSFAEVEDWYTIPQAKEYGWEIKNATPETTELTVAELEEKLNMPSGSLRVKK